MLNFGQGWKAYLRRDGLCELIRPPIALIRATKSLAPRFVIVSESRHDVPFAEKSYCN
jgi:hypothetical protein